MVRCDIILMLMLCILKSVLSEDFVNDFNSSQDNSSQENELEGDTSKNFVLDSVYDTLKHNYEIKLRQNLDKLNMLSDIRNKRNAIEPSVNYQDYYRNHQLDFNRKTPLTFPLGFKYTPKTIPVNNPGPPLHRSDYYDEDYGYQMHKCHEKPSVQTFHISDPDHEHKHHPSISTILLTGLKYLFGGFAILALPFLVLKAIFLPVKFFLFFKALALFKTFFMLTIFLRYLRYNRRYNFNRPNRPNFQFPNRPFPGRYKDQLQTIKDILNSGELEMDGDEDEYRVDDEEQLSKENDTESSIVDNPFNTTEISPEFLENLEKLIKLKGKKWRD